MFEQYYYVVANSDGKQLIDGPFVDDFQARKKWEDRSDLDGPPRYFKFRTRDRHKASQQIRSMIAKTNPVSRALKHFSHQDSTPMIQSQKRATSLYPESGGQGKAPVKGGLLDNSKEDDDDEEEW